MLKDKIQNINNLSNDVLEEYVFKGYLQSIAYALCYMEISDPDRASDVLTRLDEVTRHKVEAIKEQIYSQSFDERESKKNSSAEYIYSLLNFNPLYELSEIADEYENYDEFYDEADKSGNPEKRRFNEQNPVCEEKAYAMYLGFYDLASRISEKSIKKNLNYFDINLLASALTKRKSEEAFGENENRYSKSYKYKKVKNLFLDGFNEKVKKEIEAIIDSNYGKYSDTEITIFRRKLISEILDRAREIEISDPSYVWRM